MKILAGVDQSFEGRLVQAPGIRIGYLAQEPELNDGGARRGAAGSNAVWRGTHHHLRLQPCCTHITAS